MATWTDVQAAIRSVGQANGLTEDQIRAAIAVASSEGAQGGALTGPVYDPTADDPNAHSWGPFQFNDHGQLPGFQAWLMNQGFGPVSAATAGSLAINRVDLAAKYALSQGGYLYNAIQDGARQGLSGAQLAGYVSQHGQVTPFWRNAITAFNQLFGGVVPDVPLTGAGTSPLGQTGATSSGPGIHIPAKCTMVLGQQICSPAIDVNLPEFPAVGDIPSAITNAARGVAETAQGIIGPGVSAISNINQIAAVIGNPRVYTGLAMVGIGVLLVVLGLVLFGVSLIPNAKPVIPIPA